MKGFIKFGCIVFFLCSGLCSRGQSPEHVLDSLKLTLQEAENLFLQNNFQLLAAKYQVSAADASIMQAKLWSNPVLTIDQSAYNKYTKKWFDTSPTGQTAASLQQLILLGGKRRNAVGIAKINSAIAQYQFFDLIRTLRYTLRTDFYKLYLSLQSIAVYDREIESLRTLIDAYSDQYRKGNVAFKELARLQALQFNLENERIDLLKDASENESELTLLTGDTLARSIIPVVSESININTAQVTYGQLVDSAFTNRYDLLAANAQVSLNETNLKLQKAYRVPDLTMSANWDRAGSYIDNYNSLTLSFPLPLLNRNQGNIKAAQFQIDQSKELQSQAEVQVKSDVSRAYSRLLETDKLYTTASGQFNADYEKLLDGITLAYKNRSISLLEFIDYYETYKSSKTAFNRLQANRLEAIENLNLATGTTIIK